MSGFFRTLIDVDTLADRIADPKWRVVDCRHDLGNPEFGASAYADAHLPEAAFMHVDRDLSGPMTGRNGRHPLPDPDQLAKRLGEIGIDRDTQVVAYDDGAGMYAARLWWSLRWLGHDRVAVLNGGFRAWCDRGLPLSVELPKAVSCRFVRGQGDVPVTVEEIEARLGQPGWLLVDARGPDRFRGQNETLDPVGGHIPGAVNHFFRDNLDEQGLFRPADDLRVRLLAVLNGHAPDTVVHQCGSGVTACHNLLAMEYAGLHGSRLYAGSWSEWCADPSRPIAR